MTYKNFDRKYIGTSDIASLILVGYSDDGLKLKELHFGQDDSYFAYVVDGDVEIGDHYHKVAEFRSWLKIYDDKELTKVFNAGEIHVYRAGEMGCIIHLVY